MNKEKRILSYTISYLLIGLFICLIGISNVFAASYDYNNFTAQIYDNTGGLLEAKTTYKGTDAEDFYYSFAVNYNANSSGGAWGISSPIPLIAKHTYSMTVDPMVVGCGFTILSTYNRIGVGSTLANAKSSYESATNVNLKFSQAVSSSRYLQFVFTPTINASYIVFPFATTSTCSSAESQLSTIVIEDLGESGVSQDEINNSLNNQTNELNESIQNSTDTITGEIDDMEENIIDSNKETQDVIKDQFNDCRDSYNLLDISNFGSNTNNGINWSLLSDKITIKSIGTLSQNYSETNRYGTSLSSGTYKFYVFDTDIKVGIWLYNSSSTTPVATIYNNQTFTINETVTRYAFFFEGTRNKEYNFSFKPAISLSSNVMSKYEKFGEEICTNRIDETNDKLDNIEDTLTDSSPTDMSVLGDTAGWLPPGPVDSIINLPLTFFLNLSQSLSSECRSVSLPLPYVNKNIELPCMNSVYEKIGITGIGGFFTWVGLICSAVILFNYLLDLYHWVDKTLTMRENTMPGYYEDKWGGGA